MFASQTVFFGIGEHRLGRTFSPEVLKIAQQRCLESNVSGVVFRVRVIQMTNKLKLPA
jgi:hypothetical protein